MSDHLVAPVEGVLRGGLCIDNIDTKVWEDFIRFTRDYRRTQVDIGGLVPPVHQVPSIDILSALSCELNATDKSPLIPFLTNKLRRDLCLSEDELRKVLVVSYVYDKYTGLVYEGISVTYAKTHLKTYEEYSEYSGCTTGLPVLTAILKLKGQGAFVDTLLTELAEKKILSAECFVKLAIRLFNIQCREAGQKRKFFAIERPNVDHRRNYFRQNSGYMVFHRVLRDSTAFVNTSNLYSSITGEPSPYTQKFLKENLPPGAL